MRLEEFGEALVAAGVERRRALGEARQGEIEGAPVQFVVEIGVGLP